MSRGEFALGFDQCVGCRPVLLDTAANRLLRSDDPKMVAVNRVWSATTLAERQAFHAVCCNDSRELVDLALAEAVGERIATAIGTQS